MASDAAQKAARRAARQALAEDLGGLGDVTGRAFTGNGRATVVARESGVLSGSLPFAAMMPPITPTFTQLPQSK